ncbi:MAG TPA: c-type cytochrome [Gaiellaceae bacterium]|jgi:ubiquinol-cytochrome c reductase cytochrome c subunit
MRRVVVLAVVLPLIAAGPAAAASGTLTQPLERQGYHLYGQYCARCHSTGLGPSLDGVGAVSADFYLRMGYMPLAQLGEQPTHRNTPLLSDPQIRALVAYIASFGGPAIPQPQPALGNLSQGQALFTEHCAGCHQIVAQGGYVTGALPPPLDRVNATEIAEAVRIGPYVMPKFTEKAISDTELNSIVRYVEYTQHPDHPGGAGLDFLGPVPEGLVTWFVAIPLLLVLCLFVGRRLSA